MENWKRHKEDIRIQVRSLGKHEWDTYTGMINKLMQQLSPGTPEVTSDDFFETVGQEDFTLYIVRHVDQPEGECIGMATVFLRKLLRGWIAQIHDVVVDEKYARQGFGRLLTNRIFEYIQHRTNRHGTPTKLSLTSKPDRAKANAMYQSEGFELIAKCPVVSDVNDDGRDGGQYAKNGTNLYRKIINPE